MKPRQKVDIKIGVRIGRLSVVEEAARQGSHRVWTCRCDCGAVKSIRNDHLVKNETKPCPCLDVTAKIKTCLWCGEVFARRDKEDTRSWNRRVCCSSSHAAFYAHKKEIEITGNTLRKRFEDKYIPVTECGCWLWIGSGSIYGKLRLGADSGHRSISAHRLSYELFNGPIPEGQCVLHKCDVPACVNPRHLFLGTNQENTDDMYQKGRQSTFVPEPSRGSQHPNSKLNEQQAVSIKCDKRPYKVIAAELKISIATIKSIKAGRNWSWLNDSLVKEVGQ